MIVWINTCMWRWWGQKAIMQRAQEPEEKSDEEKKPLTTDENMMVSLDEYALFLHIGYEAVVVIYKQ